MKNEDFIEMANAIKKIISHKDRSVLMGKNLRQKALKLLDPEIGNKLQIRMFEDIFNSH